MKLVEVVRQKSQPDWTLSTFYFDGKKAGVGVEDEKRAEKVSGETRVDNGVYELALRFSPKFSGSYYRDDEGNIIKANKRGTEDLKRKYHTSHELIWVLDTPRHEYILWHWGNTDDQTNGCYLVGSTFGRLGNQDGVYSSRDKYEEIYPIMWRAIKKSVVYVNYRDEDNT